MSGRLLFSIFTLSVIVLSRAEVIENGLTGDPLVECSSESLTVRFNTKDSFLGHSYVKGHYSNSACRHDATLTDSVNITVPYNECDVVRQRSNNPRGLMLTATVIISFHPMFITKVDKSYKVQCFYSEVAKTVTNQLDVGVGRDMEKSIIMVVGDGEAPKENAQADVPSNGQLPQPTESPVVINVPLPECKYQVLNENKNGEPVKFATVGQQVYHQWSCEHPPGTKTEDNLFCATVHSCTVREETGTQAQLLDENGCAIDKYVLNNLEYTSDLTGGQASLVFKFADQSSLFFQCQIRLSLKEGGKCVRSSDHCPAVLRGKRSTPGTANEVDVLSQTMTVFDIDDPISSKTARKIASADSWSSGEVCVSPLTAGSMVTLLASVFLVSIISVSLLCLRPRTHMIKLTS